MSATEELPVILLVSGSDLIHKSIRRILKEKFKLLHAENVEQAWDILVSENSIRVVLCELGLAINEDALLHRIRNANHKSISVLPVLLMVSESDDEAMLDTAFLNGATDYIDLPLSSTELKVRVRLHAQIYGQYYEDADFELEQNTPSDLLTGVMQEKFYISRLDQELSFSVRHQLYISSALVKIVDADQIEDRHGRKVLKAINHAVARIIGQQIRREDAFAFLDEESFAVLYPVTNGMGAQVAVRRLVDKIGQTKFKFEDDKIPISVSVGLYSTLPSENQNTDEIMGILQQRVDEAIRMGPGKIVSSKAESEQEIVSLEQGLKMIRTQNTEKITGQLPHLLESVYPLLEYARQQNDASLAALLGRLDNP